MQRVLVIGCSGSGKSTFAKRLADKTGLPLMVLDKYYWQPGWIPTPASIWHQKVKTLAEQPRWIMDGTYSSTLAYRMVYADTVVFLDRTTTTCLYRAGKRILGLKGKVRESMAPGCPERFDWEFFHYIALFNWTRKARILRMMKSSFVEGPLFILKSDEEYDLFIENVAADWSDLL